MTPIEREEIEKEVNKLLNSFEYAGRRVIALPLTTKEIKERMLILLLTQVEKARAEERERCAKIAENYHWEIKWRGEPKKETKAGVTGEEIARAIRNKLNQKGEQNGKSN